MKVIPLVAYVLLVIAMVFGYRGLRSFVDGRGWFRAAYMDLGVILLSTGLLIKFL